MECYHSSFTAPDLTTTDETCTLAHSLDARNLIDILQQQQDPSFSFNWSLINSKTETPVYEWLARLKVWDDQ
jgi:hypothetical protein